MKRLVFLLLLACAKKAPPTVAKEEAPPTLDLRLRPGLMFTFLDETGEIRTTETLTDIPEARRMGVRVIDLNVPPEARGAGKWVFIADLRAPKPDGSYAYQTLSHIAFDRVLTTAAARQKVSDALALSSKQVTIYSTTWCGVCASAKRYMQQKQIAFVERDVEKDETAVMELQEKAKRAGVAPQGVPVIDVYGELMLGFDPGRLDALVQRRAAQTL